MLTHRASVICISCLCCLLLVSACAGTSSTAQYSPTTSAIHTPNPTIAPPSPTVLATPTPTYRAPTAPQHYTAHLVMQGVARPDDLIFDQQGRLLFSDAHNGTVSRINTNGSVTVLLRGLAAPEGLVMLPNGTLIIAEQGYNRILALAQGSSTPTVLRTLPGTPSTASCKDGIDGIALDSTNNTLIVPDSPTGDVYRMSPDGKTLTLLATGITRPVGATVDAQGTVYVADECGGALWRITPTGNKTRIGGFGMLDDVVLDTYGNALVIDLDPAIHALIRINLTTGKRETLASQGFIEPQGLVIDQHGDIFVSDDYANEIMEYIPT